MKKKFGYAGIAASLLGATLAISAPAQAAVAQNGVCESGEFCLYYNSDRTGSLSDFTGSIADYGTYKFKSAGAGQGQLVKNNAASVRNLTFGAVTVFYNSNYAGSSQTIAPGAAVNLNTTLKNQNASHRFGKTYLSTGLYRAYGGRISAGFDGYVNTPGKHEGIDIIKGIGAPVRALVPGQVINVVRGARGSGGLSTIAIYHSGLDKTTIYLHSAPLSTLVAGQTVTKGQQIATEDWRGVSTSGAAHTHVEMRLGRRTSAAKSVNDYTLENPDPTTFWNSQGYTER
jgi:murein DD-endopeptidase MepM/ murein hydrolase activator NlpD